MTSWAAALAEEEVVSLDPVSSPTAVPTVDPLSTSRSRAAAAEARQPTRATTAAVLVTADAAGEGDKPPDGSCESGAAACREGNTDGALKVRDQGETRGTHGRGVQGGGSGGSEGNTYAWDMIRGWHVARGMGRAIVRLFENFGLVYTVDVLKVCWACSPCGVGVRGRKG
jgi:hypothetical protein